MDSATVKKPACGFGGGMRCGEVCGAVTGALMVIGMKYGNAKAQDAESKLKCYEKTVEFENMFKNREGSIICRDLLHCDISTTGEFQYAKENNLYPLICPKMIFLAIKILREQGY